MLSLSFTLTQEELKLNSKVTFIVFPERKFLQQNSLSRPPLDACSHPCMDIKRSIIKDSFDNNKNKNTAFWLLLETHLESSQ